MFHMRLTFSTDYALRLLMLVGVETDRLVTIEEVADRFGISKLPNESSLPSRASRIRRNCSGPQRRVALGEGAESDCGVRGKEIGQIADPRFANHKGIEKPHFDFGVRIKCGDETIIIQWLVIMHEATRRSTFAAHYTSPS